MFLTHWPRRPKTDHRSHRRDRPLRFRPQIEGLEDRTLPTAGVLDSTFGVGGLVTTQFAFPNEEAKAVAVQADGKIVAAGKGSVQPNANMEFLVVRYNADGSLDDGTPSDSTPGDSFGSGGKATVEFGPGFSNANALVIQPDGRIVVAGYATAADPTSESDTDFALARLNSDGSLDTAFGTGGKVRTDFSPFSAKAQAETMALQPDGRIIVAGRRIIGFTPTGEVSDFALARYNSDGTLDSDFGGDGRVTTDIDANSEDSVQGVAVQPDGKIVVAGFSSLARYYSDGTLDSSFDVDGKVTGLPIVLDDVALQNDGKIVVAGGSNDGEFGLARFNSDGSLDSSFSFDGLVSTQLDVGGSSATSVLIQPDGKIVAGGVSIGAGYGNFALARYNANGTLDASFGSHGKATTDFSRPDVPSSNYDAALGTVLQSDGKIVLAGFSEDFLVGGTTIALARYLGDPPRPQIVVAGSDAGSQPLVRVFDSITGDEKFTFLAFDPGFTGGVRVAAGDVNGDGVPDIIAGQGPGGSQVRIFDGATGTLMPGPAGSYVVYPGFTGGIFVAAGDVNGDGKVDVVTGPDAGMGPRVKVFSGADGSLLASFRAFISAYGGGVRVAAGDVNGDGRADIIAGRGSGPAVVRVFDGLTKKPFAGPLNRLVLPNASRGGVFVTAGDVNGDGRADIIATAGLPGVQTVRIYDGATGTKLGTFQPYESTVTGTVRVGLADVDGDGRLDIITAVGSGGLPEVRYFDALTFDELDNFNFADMKSKVGVFVAGSYS